jgi:SSS family solute:Na+ symporter
MKLIEGTLFKYLQSVQAYISPPIAAVFLLGIFIKRINSQGALAALGTGFVLGIARLSLEMTKSKLDIDGLLYSYADINFLHFALFLFVICSVVMIIVVAND